MSPKSRTPNTLGRAWRLPRAPLCSQTQGSRLSPTGGSRKSTTPRPPTSHNATRKGDSSGSVFGNPARTPFPLVLPFPPLSHLHLPVMCNAPREWVSWAPFFSPCGCWATQRAAGGKRRGVRRVEGGAQGRRARRCEPPETSGTGTFPLCARVVFRLRPQLDRVEEPLADGPTQNGSIRDPLRWRTPHLGYPSRFPSILRRTGR